MPTIELTPELRNVLRAYFEIEQLAPRLNAMDQAPLLEFIKQRPADEMASAYRFFVKRGDVSAADLVNTARLLSEADRALNWAATLERLEQLKQSKQERLHVKRD